ncbi:MAG: hypothetical protein ACHQRM_08565 [Bacteroidia bacterium]
MATTPDDVISWTELVAGTNVKLLVNSLEPIVRYYFRVKVNTKREDGPWSPVLSVVLG